jgi:hypothetical protein
MSAVVEVKPAEPVEAVKAVEVPKQQQQPQTDEEFELGLVNRLLAIWDIEYGQAFPVLPAEPAEVPAEVPAAVRVIDYVRRIQFWAAKKPLDAQEADIFDKAGELVLEKAVARRVAESAFQSALRRLVVAMEAEKLFEPVLTAILTRAKRSAATLKIPSGTTALLLSLRKAIWLDKGALALAQELGLGGRVEQLGYLELVEPCTRLYDYWLAAVPADFDPAEATRAELAKRKYSTQVKLAHKNAQHSYCYARADEILGWFRSRCPDLTVAKAADEIDV